MIQICEGCGAIVRETTENCEYCGRKNPNFEASKLTEVSFIDALEKGTITMNEARELFGLSKLSGGRER